MKFFDGLVELTEVFGWFSGANSIVSGPNSTFVA